MPIIDAERLREFTAVLQKYKTGKASLERRILAAENWWRLRNRVQEAKAGFGSPEGYQSESGWLHNVIVSKHADAMDAFPEPVLLPREPDDAREAQMLSAVLPCILEQNRFEKTYDAAMWQKLKTGTAAYRVVWDPDKLGGLGDIRIDRVDLLNLFWEPGVDDIQESRYLFCTHLEDEDLLQERYPQLRGRMGGSAFRATRFVYDDAVDLSGKATVIEVYYKKRGALHYVKYVGDTVLYATENEGNAEFGIRNSELPVGDGLPDVPQPRSGDRQRAVEGASPYGADSRSPVGALHEAPADPGRLSDERARPWAGASPYEAQGDSVGAALPPLQGEVAASLRADGGVRRPPTPDRLTEDGRLIAAPTETGKTSEPNNSESRIPNSELSPDSQRRDPNSELSPHSAPRVPPSTLPPAPDLRAHFDALWAASERLAAEFDDFDPEAALRDPDFLRLTAPGLGVEPRRAWLALHPESLQRRTADALRRSLASCAARPREGGRGGALPETDYRSLSRAEQQRLKERIHRAAALGEKIYP